MYYQNKLKRLDWLLIASLMLLIGIYTLRYFDFSIHPWEDAAILMRYSKNLAAGHGIVWNVGDKPVDGATDFLFVILMAVLAKTGISLEASARLIGFISHILTVVIVYLAVRKLYRLNRGIAFISAAYLAIGPGLGYILACLGTPIFALFACLSWYFANRLLEEGRSHSISFKFALSALIMGLTRPEGVFLAIFMLLAVIYMKGPKETGMTILYFVAIFSIIGGLYFFWHWNYFGYPLPNPFYVKGGGYFHPAGLRKSIRYGIELLLPLIAVILTGFRSWPGTRRVIFLLIPVAGFIGIWVLLSPEMNYMMRFQYPVLPIAAISWPGLLGGIGKDWHLPKPSALSRRNRIILFLFMAVVVSEVLLYQHRITTSRRVYRYGSYDVAVMLSEYSDKGYTMATTEAGLLPLYSNWRVIDTWGLNDQWIAHHGGITESYLEKHKPHLIVFHTYFSPFILPRGGGKWHEMVMVLKNYAEKNGYRLAAAFGCNPFCTDWYYLRPDFPESTEILKRIRSTDYYWYTDGAKSVNFALLEISED